MFKSLPGIARQWDREKFAILTLVENTSTHQKVPKISLSLMSTILSPQGNNETKQQSFFCENDQFFSFSNHEVRKTTTQNEA